MLIDYNLIGRRVREYRCRQNLRQDDLAWDAEISVPYLSCIENGAKQASLGTFSRIAEALNITLYYLLFGDLTFGEDNEFHQLSELLNDCGEVERKIIMDILLGTAVAAKRSLRESEVLQLIKNL